MSKKKKTSGKQPVQPLSPKNIVMQRGRTYPIVECWIGKNWKEVGESSIMIIRKMGGDKYAIGVYLVDIFCLGVKDCFYLIKPDFEKEELVEQSKSADNMVLIDADLAQNIIYGAVEYAEDLGFKPHKDFAVAQYLLDDVEELEYIEVEFGRNGKPLFIAGPHDNVGLIMNTLNRTVGEGNYYFINNGEEEYEEDLDESVEALDDDERDIFTNMNDEEKLAYIFDYKIADLLEEKEYGYNITEEELIEFIKEFSTNPIVKTFDNEEDKRGFEEMVAERVTALTNIQREALEDSEEEDDEYSFIDIAIDLHFYTKRFGDVSPEALAEFQNMSSEEKLNYINEMMDKIKPSGAEGDDEDDDKGSIEDVDFEEVK